MATGLFPIREAQGGPRKGYVPKNRRPEQGRARLLDQFAESLAGGASIAQAAFRLEKTVGWGEQALRDIRRGLGWQAI